jgi:23S rRNA pseudouridine1911/1915/1917 synthase
MSFAKPNPNEKSSKVKMIYYTVKEATELMKFLMEIFPGKSRTAIKSLLSNKQVFIGDEVSTKFNHPLEVGMKVGISNEKAQKEIKLKKITIVFEDEYLIVIKKESGLLSIATDKEDELTAYSYLSDYVKEKDPNNQIYVLHRLDRETSGLMMFAKNFEAKRILQTDWQESVMERCYLAVVEGFVEKKKGTIRSWLTENANYLVYSNPTDNGGQEAITHYSVLKTNKNYSLLKIKLETGRKNQIRVHMQDIGHSVVGDKKYGSTKNPINRLGLHAYILDFRHPFTNKIMHFETPIPKEFDVMFGV